MAKKYPTESKEELTFLIPEAHSHEEAMDYIRKRHDLIFEWALWVG